MYIYICIYVYICIYGFEVRLEDPSRVLGFHLPIAG